MAIYIQDTEVGADEHVVQFCEHRPERDAPRRARHTCVAALCTHGFADTLVQDAALVTSELTTNAVVHARSPFSLTVAIEGSRLRIAVRDDTLSEDHELAPRTGHGLGLIDTIATRWGVERMPGGKVVWAELGV